MKRMLVACLVLVAGSIQAAPEDIYNRACGVCHNQGVAGAPKPGDAAAWEPRLAKGIDALIASVVNGKGAMPPKGLCNDCSEDDFKAVIEYMSK